MQTYLILAAGAACVAMLADSEPTTRPARDPIERLRTMMGGLVAAAQAERPDYAALAAEIAAGRQLAADLLVAAGKEQPAAVDVPKLPDKTPVVLFANVESPQPVLTMWKDQLVMNLRSVMEDEPNQWEAPWLRRNLPNAKAFREAHKLALMLGRPAAPLKVRTADVLFADDFSKGTDRWRLYGPCETSTSEKGLRRKNLRARNADSMIWTRPEFDGDFLFEFDFTPHNGGRQPGGLFAICGRPVKPGGDLSVSAGESMDSYNFGVFAYHFSIHRGDTGLCNGRKVGVGLDLLCRGPDPAQETGRTYRVGVGKVGDQVLFLVDGKMLHNYYDAGTFSPPLTGGSAGIRNWGGLDCTIGDVKVYRLKS
jgi:hypothetical protein